MSVTWRSRSVRSGLVLGPSLVVALLVSTVGGDSSPAGSPTRSSSLVSPRAAAAEESAPVSSSTLTIPVLPSTIIPTTTTIGPSGPGPSSTPGCTTTLSGAQRFLSLTIPANQTWCLDPNITTTVEMAGNLIVEGTLAAKPASSSVIHTIRFINANESAYVGGGMNPVATDHGLWVMGRGVLDLQGTPKAAWNRTGVDPSWSASDELVVTPVKEGDYSKFAKFKMGSPVPMAGPFRAEVLNLTRNVRIEGVAPRFEFPERGRTNLPGRAHIFIRSTEPQTLRYAAIRYMGPRQFNPDGDEDNGVSEPVLGRYGLHFHHAGDGSRGSLVEGVVVRDAGSHAFVPHASHGITFRDTIAYNVIDDAYWWDPRPREHGRGPNPDETHDVLYERAVAALVRTCDRCGGRHRLTGFRLEEGMGNAIRDSVAVGVDGLTDSSGYHWPESANQGNNVWTFQGNIAHNNEVNGVFVWQNDAGDHVVTRYVGYRNGGAGIDHGAYGNGYVYERARLYDNGQLDCSDCGRAEVELLAGSNQGGRDGALTFSDVTVDGERTSSNALLLTEHRQSDAASRLLRWTVSGYTGKAVKIDEVKGGGTIPGRYDFICWTLPGGAELEPRDFELASLYRGSVHRVQRRNGTAYRINGDRTVTPIAPFASC